MIIEQRHSDFDDREFIRGLFETFADKRYVKVLGKPVLMIYKAHLFPNILASTELWRAEAEAHGFPGLYLVMVDDWGALDSPRYLGFDASYEIPTNVMPRSVEVEPAERPHLPDDFTGRIIDYQRFAQFHAGRPFPTHKRFRTVMLPWDNAARYGSRAIVHVNVEGDGYQTWLSQALLDTYKRYPPEERFVFLHSWNEWCEGTYLEPDGKIAPLPRADPSRHRRRSRGDQDAIGGRSGCRRLVAHEPRPASEGCRRVSRLVGRRIETRYVHAELQRVRDAAERQKRQDEAEVERLRGQARQSVAEVERLRGEARQSVAEIERLLGALTSERNRFSQKKGRLTIKALRLQIALASIKRAILLPFRSQRRHQAAVIRELRSLVAYLKSTPETRG